MFKITEIKGRQQVFTLKDGKTLRVFARKSAEVAENNISDEIKRAESMGLIMITKVVTKSVSADKTGGAK